MPINSEVAQEVAKKAIFGFITWFHFPIVAIEALYQLQQMVRANLLPIFLCGREVLGRKVSKEIILDLPYKGTKFSFNMVH